LSEETKTALFLGAGASVPYGKPTTQQLKSHLLNKYKQYSDSNNSNYYFLHNIISFEGFEDIEYVLQCIKEIDDFFANSKYGGKYLLKRRLTFQYDPSRPWGLEGFTDGIKVMRKILEDEVFESYSWDHSADSSLRSIFDGLIELLRKNSKEINIFTTNYDRAIEEYCSNKEKNCRCIDGFQRDEYSNRRTWAGNYHYPKIDDETNVYLYKLQSLSIIFHGKSWLPILKYHVQ
jgi:hypothetical protein